MPAFQAWLLISALPWLRAVLSEVEEEAKSDPKKEQWGQCNVPDEVKRLKDDILSTKCETLHEALNLVQKQEQTDEAIHIGLGVLTIATSGVVDGVVDATGTELIFDTTDGTIGAAKAGVAGAKTGIKTTTGLVAATVSEGVAHGTQSCGMIANKLKTAILKKNTAHRAVSTAATAGTWLFFAGAIVVDLLGGCGIATTAATTALSVNGAAQLAGNTVHHVVNQGYIEDVKSCVDAICPFK